MNKFLYLTLSTAIAASVAISFESCSHAHRHGEEGHDHEMENPGKGDGHDHEADEHESHDEHGASGGMTSIHMEPEDAARFGVEVQKIEPAEFKDAVKVAGEVLPSSADMSTASTPTSGIVTLMPGITQGVSVKKGQIIAHVDGKGVSGGDNNAAGKAALESARREFERVAPLLEEGLVTKKEYNEALAAYESAKAAYSPRAASGAVSAPKSGVITSLVAGEGSYVSTGNAVAMISGSGRLTLRGLLPAKRSSFLSNITGAVIVAHGEDNVSVDLSGYGGRILSTDPAASTETPGYIPVYYTFDNTAPVVAGTAAEVFLTGTPRDGVISVPKGSIGEQMGQKFIFVRKDPHNYEKRFVKTGADNGMSVEILNGLHPGEEVVTSGVSYVRLAEQSTVVPEGHSHNH